jgi:hypothetical protein
MRALGKKPLARGCAFIFFWGLETVFKKTRDFGGVQI